MPGLEQARIILVPESNYAWESQRYALAIIHAAVPNVYLMDEDEKQVGMRSTNKSKKMMATLFDAALRWNTVRWHPLLVSVSGERQEMRELLIKQFSCYKRKRVEKKGANAQYEKPTEIYTGKIGGQSDDHCLMTQLNYISHNIYWNKYEEKYRMQKPLVAGRIESELD